MKENKVEFSFRKRYKTLNGIYNKKDFISRLWGPLQSMITGTIGFLLILIYRKQFSQKETLSIVQWFLIFISLFWLREVFNIFKPLLLFFIKGKREF